MDDAYSVPGFSASPLGYRGDGLADLNEQGRQVEDQEKTVKDQVRPPG